RRRHTSFDCDWSSDVCSSDLGDAVDLNPLTGITWSRIPHFYNSPYYVYQYATCFASAAKIAKQILGGGADAAGARDRFLNLLRRSEERRVGKECRARRAETY